MSAKEFNIIHFNDVYEVAQRTKEPVGGAARFATAVKGFSELNPMVLFSGDVFNPSVMSTTTKGKHMIPILNNLKVQCSVVGNHEFDFGPQVLAKNLKGCNFPWLFSNVVDKTTGEQLLGSLRLLIIDWHGVKVGLVGLVEVEWVNTTHDIDKFSKYLDFVEEGTKISAELRSLGAEIVICLAHMRMRNCVKLADSVPGVDLILAGHDHFYEINKEKKIVVSGTDFRNLTLIKASKNSDKWSFDFQKVDVTSTFSEDPEMAAIIQKFSAEADVKLNKVIGHTNTILDATNANVRTSETNVGNLFADIMRQEMKTDFAFINAGSIRSDGTYGPGDFTLKNLLTILPYVNYVVTIKISGEKVKELLEASVSSYPAQDGRFAQVSGIQFEFDPQQAAGHRVLWIKINGEPVDNQKLYIAASEGYIAKGNDGYDCLREGCEFVVDDDNAPILSTLVRKHFIVLRVLDTMDGLRKTDVERALDKWSKKKTFSVQPQIEGRIIIKGVSKTEKN